MPSPAAVRAADRVLARMGQPSLLDGADCGYVHLAYGVAVEGPQQVVSLREVATISRSTAPHPGATLTHDSGGTPTMWRLDRLVNTNGVNDQYSLIDLST